MNVMGIIVAGESASAMAYIKGRRGVSPRQTKVILSVCMLAVGVPAGAWAYGDVGAIAAAAITVEFALVGLILGAFVVGRVAGPLMRRALTKRGQAYEQTLTFELTPDGLVYDLGALVMTARWSCVTDLYRTRNYWVFLVQSSAMVLPRRFFATPEVEHDFVVEATSHMTQAALARSPDVAKFLGGQRERSHRP